MYSTAFGLRVAIPTSLAYLYLANAANRLVDDIDYFASALKILLQDISVQPKRAQQPAQKQEVQTKNKAEPKVSRQQTVKPFSEEAGRLLASASAVTNTHKDFGEENTRIANKGRVSIRQDRKTDSMTAPDLVDEYTDEATHFDDGDNR
jgi:hypothetical protein